MVYRGSWRSRCQTGTEEYAPEHAVGYEVGAVGCIGVFAYNDYNGHHHGNSKCIIEHVASI